MGVVGGRGDAHAPLRGRFDRVYVGAGVDRASCRALRRLLAPDGLLVAPRDDRHGEAQRLVTAVRRGAPRLGRGGCEGRWMCGRARA